MGVPLVIQVVTMMVGLTAYLVLSIVYRRRWDRALRVVLGRRMGLDVRWARVADMGENPTDNWYAETDGPLAKQAWQGLVIRAADIATLVVLGVLPPLALLGLELVTDFHGLVVGATAFLVIPIFGIYWSRRRADN
jgi:hypothetical protein